MKNFLKTTLAVIVGCLIVAILFVFFAFSFFGALAASFAKGEGEPVMPKNAVLLVDMSQISIQERTEGDDFNFNLNVQRMVMGGGTDSRTTLGIWDVVKAINAAAADPAVKFIYLKADDASGEMADMEEFRKALKNFRAKGKAVLAFTESPDNASYYLASVADKIFMSKYAGGMNMLIGVSSSVMYYKDILDKVGVNIQLIRHGKYKSAGEPYISNTMSDANREQYQVMLNSIWGSWAGEMANDRDMGLDRFNGLINDLKLNSPEDFLKYGLVDELVTKSEQEQRLCDLYGVDKISKVKVISLPDYVKIKASKAKESKKNAIAVIYADGQIYDGSGREEVMGDTFAHLISAVRQDSTVKAVVFRVNSPGGSVTASDKIKVEMDLLCNEKPVIASYGSYAASGGYWISNGCNRIFCNASTLTGSIGVFSIIPDFSGTAKKVGVNIYSVSTNDHSDMYGGMRALTADELAYMQEDVEEIYDAFTRVVARGRHLEQDYVDGIGQGRVWAGKDAISIGLADEIGGLEEALAYTAVLASDNHSADLSPWTIKEYPSPSTTWEKIMSKIGQGGVRSGLEAFEDTPYGDVVKMFGDLKEKDYGKAYAIMPYLIEIK